MTMESSASATVLSIEYLNGSFKVEEWTDEMLLTGDVVEELRIGNGYGDMRAPFKSGKAGIQKVLHGAFKAKETSIQVRVRRGRDEFVELQACIVPNESAWGKKQYMLRSIGEPSYAVGFLDRTEADCLALQASRMANAVAEVQLRDGYVVYEWETRMQESLQVPNSSCFLSMLLLPKASDRVASRYNDLEDTLARANAWLIASQESGVPIVFLNIQTESLLTKISGETASSTVNTASLSDLSNLANASLYGFEDYHGVDIGVVKAVRLWYSPLGGEVSFRIKLKETDTKLGFSISRTAEGFIYISSVTKDDENAPSARSGLSILYKEATRACKLLAISRVSNQKVLPWIVSPTGAVRCFDTVSLSQKLSLHRHARVPILLHLFLWDRDSASAVGSTTRLRDSLSVLPSPLEIQLVRIPNENQRVPLPFEAPSGSDSSEVLRDDSAENRLDLDTAGESSSSVHEFSMQNGWESSKYTMEDNTIVVHDQGADEKDSTSTESTDNGSECEPDYTSALTIQDVYTSNESVCELDYTISFTTQEVFSSKEELFTWIREVGKKLGFVIVIRTSDYGVGHKRSSVYLACERSGQDRQKKKLKEDSEKHGCPFDLRAYKLKNDDWTLQVVCGVHNHPAAKYLEGNSHAGRLTKEETSVSVDIAKVTARPQILATLNGKDSQRKSATKTIYNVNDTGPTRPFPYVDALPGGLKPYINLINDVESDGNCGFRAIAVSIGLTEGDWVQVRNDLISELNTHRDDYADLYGSYRRTEELAYILSYFKDNPRKNHWMIMPDMGHLIASFYNVVLFHLSAQQCLTFLPLRSVPQLPILRHEIAIGFVNGNHFVQVSLKPGHPVPPIATNWHKYRHHCAEGWKNAYAYRIQKFIGIVSSSVATRETFDSIDL